MGAWIEILSGRPSCAGSGSLPTWERGLKSFHIQSIFWLCFVAPYMGAWIEILPPPILSSSFKVAPYMGAWIEISLFKAFKSNIMSLPTWERGLK